MRKVTNGACVLAFLLIIAIAFYLKSLEDNTRLILGLNVWVELAAKKEAELNYFKGDKVFYQIDRSVKQGTIIGSLENHPVRAWALSLDINKMDVLFVENYNDKMAFLIASEDTAGGKSR